MKHPAVTVDEALKAASETKGNTLMVLVSMRQAERLYLAIKIADAYTIGDYGACAELVVRYEELDDVPKV